jgi:hypothetical protein
MMKLTTRIYELGHKAPNDDPRELAEQLLGELADDDDLLDVLAHDIAFAQRSAVRTVESNAFRTKIGEPVTLEPATPAFRALMERGFKLGDGTRVVWADATVPQHAQRVAYLEKIRDGIDQTIDRHREAIRLIEQAGVTCLAELEEQAA